MVRDAELCLAVGAENVDDLVCDHVLDSLTCGLEVLAGVKMIGMLDKVLADVRGGYRSRY